MIGEAEDARVEDFGAASGSAIAFAVGFFLSFRTVLVLLSVRVLGMEARTGSAASLALGLLLLGVVIFASDDAGWPVGRMLRLGPLRWVVVFLAVSGCSLAWSETVSLPSSLAYWGGMAADVATVAVLLHSRPVASVAHSLMKGFIWSTCCLALLAWAMPAQTDLRLGDPDFFNTNQIGNLCAFSILLAQYLMRRKDGRWGAAIVLLSLTLLRSLSKTTIVAFVVSESLLLIMDRSMRRRTKVLLATAVIAAILAFWGLFEAYFDVYMSAGNQAETLTGRVGIWAWVLTEAVERPWLGHGFDALWKVIPPFGQDQFEARHAENELLQQFYAYGVAGIVMLCGIYGSFYAKVRRVREAPLRVALLSLLVFVLVRGLAEAEPFDLLLPLWAIVLLSAEVDCLALRGEQAAVVRRHAAGASDGLPAMP